MTIILDRHSQMAASAESHYLSKCYAQAPAETDPDGLVRLFAANNRAADLRIEPEELRRELGSGTSSHAELIGAVLGIVARRKGKAVPVEKTPGHLRYTPLLMDWFPGARVVCMIRDGRDVALSLRRMPWTHNDLVRHGLKWRRAAKAAATFSRRYPDRFLIVHYEDLVAAPHSTVSQVMAFLGQQGEQAQLLPGAAGDVIPDWEAGWKEQAAGAIHADRIGCWRTESSVLDRVVMHAVMGRFLATFGYPDVPRVFQ